MTDNAMFAVLPASGGAARANTRGDQPAARDLVLRSFQSRRKGKLLGFVSVELACGLVLVDLPVFVGPDGPWVALPRKAVLDRERRQSSDASGRPSFQAVAKWRNRDLADAFSAHVVDLLRKAHPRVFDVVGR